MVTFDKIEYTEADAGRTYKYEVLEATPDGNGYTVDKTVYTVEVTVTDNRDGTLLVTPTYKNGETVVSDISFDNTYKATGRLTLTASKTVNGKKPTEKQKYNFELRSAITARRSKTSAARWPSMRSTTRRMMRAIPTSTP